LKICAFDLETIADKSKINFLPEVKPDKRIVVPAKIEADIAKKKQKQINEMALIPATAMICVFGWHDGKEPHSILLEEETPEAERDLLVNAWKELKKAEHYVTFNGIGYDVPVLLMRSLINRVKPSVKISTKKYVIANHTDIRAVLGNWDTYAKGTLDYYMNLLLGRTSKEELSGDMVQDTWDMGLGADIAKYCEADCQGSFDLYDLMVQYYL